MTKYEAADQWKDFGRIVPLTNEEMAIRLLEWAMPTMEIKYDLKGRKTYNKGKGLNIIRMSDGTVKKVMKK